MAVSAQWRRFHHAAISRDELTRRMPGVMVSIDLETDRFNAAVQRHTKKVKMAVAKVLLKAMTVAMRQTVKEWPVDTGRSRAAWYPFFDHFGLATPRGKSSKNLSPMAVEQGRSEGSVIDRLARKRDPQIIVINAVPYSGFLEAGWSAQAPAGVVRRAMREARRALPELVKAEVR